MFENVERGTYAVGNQEIYFRSKWEANWALYLEFRKRNREIYDWEYEPERYDFIYQDGKKLRSLGLGYLPDFRVWDTKETFHLEEVKGYKQGLQKVKRMKKYYPHIKVEVIDKEIYNEIKRKLGRVLHFY